MFGFIRRMNNERRNKIRNRLAIVYAIVAWNSCAYFIYINHKERILNNDLPPGLQYSSLSTNIEKTKVINMEGMKVVEKISYNKEEIDDARHQIETGNIIDDTDNF